MIRAEVHSDDYAATAEFDATAWFQQASDDAIESLIACDFGGDYAADDVAWWQGERDRTVAAVFAYDELARTGFECYVNPDAACAWIKANRPHLYSQLEGRVE